MANSIIAVDSARHIRTWPKGQFFASIGTCLSLDDCDAFKKSYLKVIEDLLPQYGITRKKNVYKSYEIAKAFGSRTNLFHNFLAQFTLKILALPGVRITVFYTTLNTRLLENNVQDEDTLSQEDEEKQPYEDFVRGATKPIQVYGGEGSPVKQISTKEFLDKLDNYYVTICAWKLTDLTKIYNKNFILDGFEGEVTDAWLALTRSNQVAVAYKGDQCNAYISAADLVTRFADMRLRLWRFPLTKDALYRMFNALLEEDGTIRNRYFIKRIWNPDISKIVPSSRRPIDIQVHMLHPCIFICKEEPTAEERIRLENSPMFDEILDRAFQIDGCVQFYEPKKHTALMGDKDIFVTYGENGRGEFKKLSKMKYKLSQWDFP